MTYEYYSEGGGGELDAITAKEAITEVASMYPKGWRAYVSILEVDETYHSDSDPGATRCREINTRTGNPGLWEIR